MEENYSEGTVQDFDYMVNTRPSNPLVDFGIDDSQYEDLKTNGMLSFYGMRDYWIDKMYAKIREKFDGNKRMGSFQCFDFLSNVVFKGVSVENIRKGVYNDRYVKKPWKSTDILPTLTEYELEEFRKTYVTGKASNRSSRRRYLRR